MKDSPDGSGKKKRPRQKDVTSDGVETPEDLVLTPGGRRPRRLVRAIQHGESIKAKDEGADVVLAPLDKANANDEQEVKKMKGELVLTPGGWRNRSLAHLVEKDHAIHMEQGRAHLLNLGTRKLVEVPHILAGPGDVPTFGSGWITYASWMNDTSTPVSSFRTTFRVPPPPATASSQTVFLFPGIDPRNISEAILQPVLQWGTSFAGGGPYWTVASWLVLGNGQAFFTPLETVNVGDTLVGVIKLTGQSGGKFDYTSEFEGIAGTLLTVQNVDELAWCNETLEAYNITASTDYPGTDLTSMTGIDLLAGATNPPMHWTPVNSVTDCGQHTVVLHDGSTGAEIDIYYRNPKWQIDFGQFVELSDSVRVLFAVTNDGGGIVILPNGHVVRIPPRGPNSMLFRQMADALADIGRGFAIREYIQGASTKEPIKTIDRSSLNLVLHALESALEAVKREIVE